MAHCGIGAQVAFRGCGVGYNPVTPCRGRNEMKFFSFLLTGSLLAMGCGESSPAQSRDVSETLPDTIIVSPSHTIGILMGDSNYVFGTIADAILLDGGNIAILDEAAGCARLYDPHGGFISQVSRRGSGPGEVILPGGIVRLSDNSIAILDHASGIHRFTEDGEFLEFMTDYQGQDVPQWAWGVDNMGYVGAITSMEPSDDALMVHFIVGRWDEGSQPSVEYFRNSFPFNPARMDEFLSNTFFSASFAASPDGYVFVAPTSSQEYSIDVFNPDGSLHGTIERNIPGVVKTEAELEDEITMITAILKERGIPEDHIMYEPDPYRWMIPPQGIGADGEGRVWVRNGTADDVLMDVYSREGEHLAVVRFQGVANPNELDFLNMKVQPGRILIYSLQDPDYPRLFVVDMPEIT